MREVGVAGSEPQRVSRRFPQVDPMKSNPLANSTMGIDRNQRAEDEAPYAVDDVHFTQPEADNVVDLYLEIHTTKIENKKLKTEVINLQEQL